MGTRGAYGFFRSGETKVAYNHFDSYPTGLGAEIVNGLHMELRRHDFEDDATLRKYLQRVSDTIRLVPEEDKPRGELAKNAQLCWHLTGPGEQDTWYDWLRPLQGDIRVWFEPCVTLPMPDATEFLHDSLFCEWAYVVNVDSLVLEVHRGFNKNPLALGRYVSRPHDADGDYWGVYLLTSIPLRDIIDDPAGAIRRMENLEESYG